jgi:hypothetical protein
MEPAYSYHLEQFAVCWGHPPGLTAWYAVESMEEVSQMAGYQSLWEVGNQTLNLKTMERVVDKQSLTIDKQSLLTDTSFLVPYFLLSLALIAMILIAMDLESRLARGVWRFVMACI